MPNNEIYLDNAATTKVLNSSAEICSELMTEFFANPSSAHRFGFLAEKRLKEARELILSEVGVSSRTHSLIFTSSGTESDNLAVLGVAMNARKKGNRILIGNSEHPAVYNCKDALEKLGYEVLLIPNVNGEISTEFIRENLNEKTVLISHMAINNETGAIYDIKKVVQLRNELSPKCLIHTDAVQAFMKTEGKLSNFGSDLISISAHKIHAPKGCGALIYNKRINLAPIIFGGGQESGLRSGTEAVHNICAFANSVKILSVDKEKHLNNAKCLHDYLSDLLSKKVPEAKIIIPKIYTPYIFAFTLPKMKSEVMLRYLSDKGIYISAGSACSSKHRENRILTNFGLSHEDADTYLRVSFSHENTKEELDIFVENLRQGYDSLARLK